MGLSGISIPSLLIILVIVLLLFGTKKLKNLGGDLGGAIKGFKKAMGDEEKANQEETKKVEAESSNTQTEQQTQTDKTDVK